MKSCEYNQVLNKIYSIIRKNNRICKLLYYTSDVDIDDVSKCPDLSPSQLSQVWSKYIKKMLDIKLINDEARAYICLKFSTIDFSSGNSYKDGYQPYWSNSLINLHVICADNIEELQGNSRCMEICSEIQKELTMADIDVIGNSYICNITETRVVDGYTSYVIQITFYNKNDSAISR